MPEVERLRDQVEKCRRLALTAGDIAIERRIGALGDEFEAKAVRAEAQANCGHGGFAQVGANPNERRKIALTNFNKSSYDVVWS
jgi:hypothetical protein